MFSFRGEDQHIRGEPNPNRGCWKIVDLSGCRRSRSGHHAGARRSRGGNAEFERRCEIAGEKRSTGGCGGLAPYSRVLAVLAEGFIEGEVEVHEYLVWNLRGAGARGVSGRCVEVWGAGPGRRRRNGSRRRRRSTGHWGRARDLDHAMIGAADAGVSFFLWGRVSSAKLNIPFDRK
jgi:hypothetical protein